MKLRTKILTLTLLLVTLTSAIGASLYTRSIIGYKSTAEQSSAKVGDVTDRDLKNILLIGVDERNHDKGRSDTLLLLTVDTQEKKISVVSIPRDSMVDIKGHGFTKINHSYGYGGSELTTETVEQAMGVAVDAHVTVNFDEFEKIIDKFGGVKITAEKDMNYVDRAGNVNISIKSGVQVLDGKSALDFARFRHDRLGDLGRMRRQRQLLEALIGKMKNPKMAISALTTIEDTTLQPRDVLALWPVVKDSSSYDIQYSTATGESKRIGSADYYILDANRTEIEQSGYLRAEQETGPGQAVATITPIVEVPISPTAGLGAESTRP